MSGLPISQLNDKFLKYSEGGDLALVYIRACRLYCYFQYSSFLYVHLGVVLKVILFWFELFQQLRPHFVKQNKT